MTIGQVSKAVGIAPSAIRFYESAGILPQPRRKNGVRDYDASIITQLKVLRFLRDSGVSVRGLAAADRHAEVERRIVELDELIQSATAMKQRLQSLLACECNGDAEKCVIFA
jgi:DNA-binding transcriptional MerR regulator